MHTDMRRRELVRGLAVSTLSGLLQGVMANHARGANSSAFSFEDVEAAIADQFWQDYLATDGSFVRHPDRQAEQALQDIASPIMATSTRRNLDWRIGLVPAETINAMTPGNGVIIVYEGLIRLCDNEAELASVIAHEVGHIEHRHAINRLVASTILDEEVINIRWSSEQQAQIERAYRSGELERIAQQLVYKSFTRLWEHEADAYIVRAFRTLGYPMQASYTFFDKLISNFGDSNPNNCLFDTHPLTQERIRRLQGLSRAYGQSRSRADSDAFAYLKARADRA